MTIRNNETSAAALSLTVHISYGRDFSRFVRCEANSFPGVIRNLIGSGFKRFIVDTGNGVFHVTASSGRITHTRQVA